MIENLLNATVTVYRAAFASDGAGGRTRSMAAHGTIRAMVSQPGAQELAMAAQQGVTLSAVVYTTADADVERGDELDAGDARRLRVLAVYHNSRRSYTRLDCEERQGG